MTEVEEAMQHINRRFDDMENGLNDMWGDIEYLCDRLDKMQTGLNVLLKHHGYEDSGKDPFRPSRRREAMTYEVAIKELREAVRAYDVAVGLQDSFAPPPQHKIMENIVRTAKELKVAWRRMHSGFIGQFATESDSTDIKNTVENAQRVLDDLAASEQGDGDTEGTT